MDDKNEQEKKSNTGSWASCLVTLIVLAVIEGFIISLVIHIYWLTVMIAGCFLLALDSILLIGEFEKKTKKKFYISAYHFGCRWLRSYMRNHVEN